MIGTLAATSPVTVVLTNPVFTPDGPPLPGSLAHDGNRVWPQDADTWLYFLKLHQNTILLGAALLAAVALIRRSRS